MSQNQLSGNAASRMEEPDPEVRPQAKRRIFSAEYKLRLLQEAGARDWARDLLQWYNHEHYHSHLGLLAPAMVHNGQVPAVLDACRQVLQVAHANCLERFARGLPTVPELPTEAWINRPQPNHLDLQPTWGQLPRLRHLFF